MMVCNNCGKLLEEGLNFCPDCGAALGNCTTEKKKHGKNTSHKQTVIISVVLAGSILICGTAVLVDSAIRTNTARNNLDMGYRFLDDENYEQSIFCFNHMIKIAPNNPDSYLGKAQALAALGRTDDAIATLELGLSYADDDHLNEYLSELLSASPVNDSSEKQPEEEEIIEIEPTNETTIPENQIITEEHSPSEIDPPEENCDIPFETDYRNYVIDDTYYPLYYKHTYPDSEKYSERTFQDGAIVETEYEQPGVFTSQYFKSVDGSVDNLYKSAERKENNGEYKLYKYELTGKNGEVAVVGEEGDLNIGFGSDTGLYAYDSDGDLYCTIIEPMGGDLNIYVYDYTDQGYENRTGMYSAYYVYGDEAQEVINCTNKTEYTTKLTSFTGVGKYYSDQEYVSVFCHIDDNRIGLYYYPSDSGPSDNMNVFCFDITSPDNMYETETIYDNNGYLVERRGFQIQNAFSHNEKKTLSDHEIFVRDSKGNITLKKKLTNTNATNALGEQSNEYTCTCYEYNANGDCIKKMTYDNEIGDGFTVITEYRDGITDIKYTAKYNESGCLYSFAEEKSQYGFLLSKKEESGRYWWGNQCDEVMSVLEKNSVYTAVIDTDVHGLITGIDFVNDAGVVMDTLSYNYFYDEADNYKLKFYMFDYHKETIAADIFTYDFSPTDKSFYDSWGEYEYDSNGNPISGTVYTSERTIVSQMTAEYVRKDTVFS